MKKIAFKSVIRNSVIFTLILFNIRWYGEIMKDVFFRYKIWIVFFTAILAPTLRSLYYLMATPLRVTLTYPVVNIVGISIPLLIYQLFSLGWVMIFHRSLSEQSWKNYVASLNISHFEHCISDLLVLIVIDSIIWIPLFLAGIQGILSVSDVGVQFVLILFKCISTVAFILMIQMSFIKRSGKLFGLFFALDMVYIFIISSFKPLVQIMTILVIISSIFLSIYLCYQEKLYLSDRKCSASFTERKASSILALFPLSKIQLEDLMKNISHFSMIFLTLLVMMLLFVYVSIYAIANEKYLFFISVIFLINGLIISNLFQRMHTRWKIFSCYLLSLPISGFTLFQVNMVTVSSIVLFVNLLFFCTSLLLGYHFLHINAFEMLFIPILFLPFAYLPQVRLKRYGMFFSFCLMLVFSYINYILFCSGLIS